MCKDKEIFVNVFGFDELNGAVLYFDVLDKLRHIFGFMN